MPVPTGFFGTRAERPYIKRRAGNNDVVVNPGGNVQSVSAFEPGWVHTDHDKLPLSSTMLGHLAAASPSQGQHEQGFGAGAIWPTQSGAKNWGSLDARFGTPGDKSTGTLRDASELVLYACGCPAWMKGGKSTATSVNAAFGNVDPIAVGDLTNEFKYDAPASVHYADYAQLIADTVTRYTQITHVVVWNEFKGFFMTNGANRWWYEGYTALYNAVYNAVKAVRPTVKVGGPYAVWSTLGWQFPNDWADDAETDTTNRLQGHAPYHWGYADKKILAIIKYWLTNAVGADFFAMDVRNSVKDFAAADAENTTYTAAVWNTNPDGGTKPYYWPTSPMNCGQKLADMVAYFRGLGASNPSLYGRSVCDSRTLPIWFMETYANALTNHQVINPNTGVNYPDPVSTDQEMVATAAEFKRRGLIAGVARLMFWRCYGDAAGHANPLALFDSSGAATGLRTVDQWYGDNFATGAQILDVSNPIPDQVGLLATATQALLINKTGVNQSIVLDAVTQSLTPWQVRLVSRTTSTVTNPSGQAMPNANLTNFRLVFNDDFNTDVPLGSFPSAVSTRWGGYGPSTLQTGGTGDTTGHGKYNSPKVISVSGSMMRKFIHTADGFHYVAAPYPKLPGTDNCRLDYGRVAIRARADVLPGYKTAWLLWPTSTMWPRDGEIDFPEGDLEALTDNPSKIKGFMHRQDATAGSDQDQRLSNTVWSGTGWHTFVTEWMPGICRFILDGVEIGTDITARVPNTQMRWVIQTETELNFGTDTTPNTTSGYIEIDWVAVWQYDTSIP